MGTYAIFAKVNRVRVGQSVDKMNSYDEPTIYNLLTVEETKEKKPKAYTSKFRQNVKEEYTSGRGGHKTMGPAKVNAPQPTDYLKKHDKEPNLPTKEGFKYPDDSRKRPPVPKINDTPLMGLKTTKNFISTNAVENITAVPKLPGKKLWTQRTVTFRTSFPQDMSLFLCTKRNMVRSRCICQNAKRRSRGLRRSMISTSQSRSDALLCGSSLMMRDRQSLMDSRPTGKTFRISTRGCLL